MSIPEIDARSASHITPVTPDWRVFPHENVYQCHVILWPEDSGFSAHCANLAGVISQGETEPEALENIAACFRETVLYYRESKTAIPWGPVNVERPANSVERWIEVRM